jgi:hypothetical protein
MSFAGAEEPVGQVQDAEAVARATQELSRLAAVGERLTVSEALKTSNRLITMAAVSRFETAHYQRLQELMPPEWPKMKRRRCRRLSTILSNGT